MSGIGTHQPSDQRKQGRLSASGSADEACGLTLGQVEVDRSSTSSLEEPLPYDFDTASRRTKGWPEVGAHAVSLRARQCPAGLPIALDHHRGVLMGKWYLRWTIRDQDGAIASPQIERPSLRGRLWQAA